jgi:hypothetical protein
VQLKKYIFNPRLESGDVESWVCVFFVFCFFATPDDEWGHETGNSAP